MIQSITTALDVGYLANRHCQFFGAPALAEHLFHPVSRRQGSDFRSEFGETRGLYAPCECGEWWYRFFRRRPAYVTLGDVREANMVGFRRSVAALTKAFDRPVLFKNLYASLRINAIARYLPESLFIVVHRNEIDNGHSLLETRLKVFKDYGRWWSMEPPDIDRIRNLPPHEQVIEQIRQIHATIDDDLSASDVASGRRLDVSYEEFCANPRGTVGAVQAFLKDNGCVVEQVGTIPETFKRREEVRIDPTLYAAMVRYVDGV